MYLHKALHVYHRASQDQLEHWEYTETGELLQVWVCNSFRGCYSWQSRLSSSRQEALSQQSSGTLKSIMWTTWAIPSASLAVATGTWYNNSKSRHQVDWWVDLKQLCIQPCALRQPTFWGWALQVLQNQYPIWLQTAVYVCIYDPHQFTLAPVANMCSKSPSTIYTCIMTNSSILTFPHAWKGRNRSWNQDVFVWYLWKMCSQSLGDAFHIHIEALVLKVQNAVKNCWLHSRNYIWVCDWYPWFNANLAVTWLCILIKSAPHFSEIAASLVSMNLLGVGIRQFSESCFVHGKDQLEQVMNDVQSVQRTLLPLQAYIIGQCSHTSLVYFVLIITPLVV